MVSVILKQIETENYRDILKVFTENKSVLFDSEQNFYFLYEHFNFNMIFKIQIIVHHYAYYFEKMGKTLNKQMVNHFKLSIAVSRNKKKEEEVISVILPKIFLPIVFSQ